MSAPVPSAAVSLGPAVLSDDRPGGKGSVAEGLGPLLLFAWVLLTLGITVNNGAYRDKAIAAVVLGLVFVVVAAVRLRRRPAGDPLPTASDPPVLGLAAGLAVAAGVGLAVSMSYDLGLYGAGEALTRSRALSVLSGVLAVATVLAVPRLRPVTGAAGVLTATAALITMIMASPRPAIDVWYILTEGGRQLVDGGNLYTSCWPGNTDRLTDCVYPYLPVTSVVQAPFRLLFGDVRYSYVAALLVAAAALWMLGGARWGPGLAVVLLVTPKGTFLVEQAWTEPLLLAGLAVMVLATVRGQLTVAVIALAFALACKQHILLLLPLAALWPAFGWRRTVVSAVAAGVATLPWLLADPRAFLDDALWFNLELTPRLDSLSLFTTALTSGVTPPFAVVGAVSLVAIGAACALPRTALGFAVGAVLVQYVFDIANKQSFFNHWWLVSGLLLLAVATACQQDGAAGSRAGPRAPSDTARR